MNSSSIKSLLSKHVAYSSEYLQDSASDVPALPAPLNTHEAAFLKYLTDSANMGISPPISNVHQQRDQFSSPLLPTSNFSPQTSSEGTTSLSADLLLAAGFGGTNVSNSNINQHTLPPGLQTDPSLLMLSQASLSQASLSQSSTQQTTPFRLPSPQSQQPGSMLITDNTDVMTSAGLIIFTFAQSGSSFFILHTAPPTESGSNNPSLETALHVALCARKINTQAGGGFDVGFVPFLVNEDTEHLGLLVYRCIIPDSPSTQGKSAHVLRIEPHSDPLLAGLSLYNIMNSSTLPNTEVIFGTDNACMAMQTLSIMRLNLTAANQDVILLPQLIDWPGQGGDGGRGSSLHFHLRMQPTTHVLPCFQRQFDLRDMQQQFQQQLQQQQMQQMQQQQSISLPGGLTALPMGALGYSQIQDMQQRVSQSQHVGDFYSMQNMQNMQGHMSGLNSSSASASSGAPTAGSIDMLQQMLQAQSISNSGRGFQQQQQQHVSSNGWPGQQQQHSGHHHHQQQNQPLYHQNGGVNHAMYGQFPGSMSGSATPSARPSSNGGSSLAGTSSASSKLRARKADYVIVTEDTAIKNAAGAVTKVLTRVSILGQCCPVYTEKRNDCFTAVISVAVKAIAVARGYVYNEGTGHEVGFQPFLHLSGDKAPLDEHGSLGSALGLMMNSGGAESYLSESGRRSGGPALAGGVSAIQQLQQLVRQKSRQQQPPGMMNGKVSTGGVMYDTCNGMLSSEQVEVALQEAGVHDERRELAFDVYKVPIMLAAESDDNLPVKVTAHSRPNVVSNVIFKLVTERKTAVLITAGGKALHVAMSAVVSARARLSAKNIDVILIPKFVTVDTTSTLGWESVFLRFSIIRWVPPILTTLPSQQLQLPQQLQMPQQQQLQMQQQLQQQLLMSQQQNMLLQQPMQQNMLQQSSDMQQQLLRMGSRESGGLPTNLMLQSSRYS